jgi:hypothetical protein
MFRASLVVPIVVACSRERELPVPQERSSAVRPSVTAASSASPVASIAASNARATQPPFEGTAGILEVKRTDAYPAEVVAVREARHDGFDRVVFEFRGAVPGYHLEYIDKPVRDCGAGNVVPIEGDGWLEVRLFPANAHDDAGRPLLPERERKVTLGVLREIERTCDFEAVVTHVIGLSVPNRYRVLELEDPSRLVVDVRHGR